VCFYDSLKLTVIHVCEKMVFAEAIHSQTVCSQIENTQQDILQKEWISFPQ